MDLLWGTIRLISVLCLLCAGETTPGAPDCTPCICLSPSAVVTADCSNRSLTHIPTSLPPNIAHLDMSLNSLTTISETTLGRYRNLETLNLANNSIRGLPQGVFEGTRSIHEVDFSGNIIHTLSYDEFDGAPPTLRVIRGLSVNNIDSSAFATLGLIELHLRVNSGCIAENLFVPLPLTRLQLELPSCMNLPVDALSQLTETLEHLVLNAPRLTQLQTTHLQTLVRLQTLTLTVNLTTVPVDFFYGDLYVDCTNLNDWQCATIRGNKMKQSLGEISVSGIRNLTTEHFQNLKNLLTVRIHQSEIVPESFPDTVGVLDLSQNDLAELNPEHIRGPLVSLNMSRNRIQTIPSGIFSNSSSNLTVLDLSHNGIMDLNVPEISPLADHLQILNLEGNQFCPLSVTEVADLMRIPNLILDEGCLVGYVTIPGSVTNSDSGLPSQTTEPTQREAQNNGVTPSSWSRVYKSPSSNEEPELTNPAGETSDLASSPSLPISSTFTDTEKNFTTRSGSVANSDSGLSHQATTPTQTEAENNGATPSSQSSDYRSWSSGTETELTTAASETSESASSPSSRSINSTFVNAEEDFSTRVPLLRVTESTPNDYESTTSSHRSSSGIKPTKHLSTSTRRTSDLSSVTTRVTTSHSGGHRFQTDASTHDDHSSNVASAVTVVTENITDASMGSGIKPSREIGTESVLELATHESTFPSVTIGSETLDPEITPEGSPSKFTEVNVCPRTPCPEKSCKQCEIHPSLIPWLVAVIVMLSVLLVLLIFLIVGMAKSRTPRYMDRVHTNSNRNQTSDIGLQRLNDGRLDGGLMADGHSPTSEEGWIVPEEMYRGVPEERYRVVPDDRYSLTLKSDGEGHSLTSDEGEYSLTSDGLGYNLLIS